MLMVLEEEEIEILRENSHQIGHGNCHGHVEVNCDHDVIGIEKECHKHISKGNQDKISS
jgi:hypothetical protein